MNSFFQKYILQGLEPVDLRNENRRVIYSNIIYITLPVVYLIFVMIDFRSYLKPVQELKWDQFIFLVMILICLLGIFLNRVGYSLVGRLIFLISWPVLLHLIPIWKLATPSDYYLAFPTGLMFHAMLIQLMTSMREEPWSFWPLMVFNFLLALFSVQVLLYFEDDRNEGLLTMVSDLYYRLDIVLYWLLFTLVTYFLVRAIEGLFKQMLTDQALIKQQQEAMAVINDQLTQSNKSLNRMNKRVLQWNEQLELSVAARTREIEQQNEKLRNYSFMNAHRLRGPFCRIKGLLMLKEVDPHGTDAARIDRMLEQSVEELEQVIHEIQRTVSESESARTVEEKFDE